MLISDITNPFFTALIPGRRHRPRGRIFVIVPNTDELPDLEAQRLRDMVDSGEALR